MSSAHPLFRDLDVGSHFPNRRDFPRVGFNFPDITPILERRPDVFAAIISALVEICRSDDPDYIACVESFGYVFGVPVALATARPIVLVRRAGKLPRPAITTRYKMCYDDDRRLEIHADAIPRGARVLIVDDFLASGGTAVAAAELLRAAGGQVTTAAFVVELPVLKGGDALREAGLNTTALIRLRFSPADGKWHHSDVSEGSDPAGPLRGSTC